MASSSRSSSKSCCAHRPTATKRRPALPIDRGATSTRMPIQEIEGTFQVSENARFAIVATRWNEFIVDRLIEGALDGLRRHGVDEDHIRLVRVPGAFEIPVACKQLIDAGG